MLALPSQGEWVSERGKTKTAISADLFETMVKNFFVDHEYRGTFEISVRRLDEEPPVQVKLCDASKFLFEEEPANSRLLHQHTEDPCVISEEEQKHVVSKEEEDINDKWEDRLGFWRGWDRFTDSLRRRPTQLPIYSKRLSANGHIQANSYYLPRIKTSVSWSGGGLPCCVWELESLTTKCKRVLLVFDTEIQDAILPYVAEHTSDYLVVMVYWDAESYLLLRKLAQSVTGLTFIALTDLDHHHLDCLTFLAASPKELLTHYSWDLSKECRLTGVNEDATLDIKWLGLRPSDIDTHAACFKLFALKQGETDFKTVTNRLLTIPTFTKNQAWKAELQRLQDRPLFMPFAFIKPTRDVDGFSYIKNVYLPQKLDKEGWV